MRKSGLLLIGAAVFDLGTIVVSSHAENVSLNFAKVEIDATHTAAACATGGGTVVASGGAKFCQTPTGTPAALHVRKAGGTQQEFLKVKMTDISVTKKAVSTTPKQGQGQLHVTKQVDPAMPNAATKAPAKKEEAKKE